MKVTRKSGRVPDRRKVRRKSTEAGLISRALDFVAGSWVRMVCTVLVAIVCTITLVWSSSYFGVSIELGIVKINPASGR